LAASGTQVILLSIEYPWNTFIDKEPALGGNMDFVEWKLAFMDFRSIYIAKLFNELNTAAVGCLKTRAEKVLSREKKCSDGRS
jgi:hypothetical protein